MRALFITTKTVDCANHVRAWDSLGHKAAHMTFDHSAMRNDWQFLDKAREVRPEIIFYIGAHQAQGNPRPATLIEMRSIAPTIHLCSDATDRPWHPVLVGYRVRGCFDLQVGIDGGGLVDLATLTPVDPGPFEVRCERDIRCGFSGSVGRWNARSEIVKALEWFGGLTVRNRAPHGGYEEHARFMKRCRMLLNLSFTGSQHAHHIKGRVVEAGYAGCALLESADSPIGDWFPEDCYLTWRDAKDIAALIADAGDETMERAARRLSEEVRKRYTARAIYGEILDRVGSAVARPAA